MAITIGNHISGYSPDLNSVTTTGIDTTGASLIVVAVGCDDRSFPTNISDNKGNSGNFTGLTAYTSGAGNGNHQVRFFYINPGANVGTNHTFTAASTGGAPVITVVALNGTATSTPFDTGQEDGKNKTTSVMPIQCTTGVNPSVDNCIVLAFFWGGLVTDADVPSIDQSFSLLENQGAHGAPSYTDHLTLFTLIQTTKGAVNPTVNATNGAYYGNLALATFKASAAAGQPAGRRQLKASPGHRRVFTM